MSYSAIVQPGPQRVSWVTGIIYGGDALSETVLAEMDALHGVSHELRRPVEGVAYCRNTDQQDSRIRIVESPKDLLADPHFLTSDVYVFHFGVFNELHDVMNFVRRDAKVVVWYHNITPPQYLAPSQEALTHQSYQQTEIFRCADLVLCNSDHTREGLDRNLRHHDIRSLPLFGKNVATSQRAVQLPTREIRLFTCGRFIRSKALHHLLEAAEHVALPDDTRLVIGLAGLLPHSDHDYVATLKAKAETLPPHVKIRFLFDLPEDALREEMIAADLFVLPSLHEGFGMPLVEALSHGLPVVASDAAALPEVSQGLALHYPAGDVSALASALSQQIASLIDGVVDCTKGQAPVEVWRESAARLASQYTRAAYTARYAQLMREWLTAADSVTTESRAALLRRAAAHLIPIGEHDTRDRIDASVNAYARAQRVKRKAAIASDEEIILEVLQWIWPNVDQAESSISYWKDVLSRKGARGLLEQLSNAPELRQKESDMPSIGTYRSVVQAALEARSRSRQLVPQEDPIAKRYDRARLTIGKSPKMPDTVFIGEAYKLILGRDADPSGLANYGNLLKMGEMTRDGILQALANSDEAKQLRY